MNRTRTLFLPLNCSHSNRENGPVPTYCNVTRHVISAGSPKEGMVMGERWSFSWIVFWFFGEEI